MEVKLYLSAEDVAATIDELEGEEEIESFYDDFVFFISDALKSQNSTELYSNIIEKLILDMAVLSYDDTQNLLEDVCAKMEGE